ncbi:hypothetical protein [Hymenobacter sp. CRA2]|uniref:hypothetical protein n=1 Tax=Hymenobacter sp. CRA2 TaxID=1955620 RepID=UPI0011163C85|nr:hypothetical protein [Hymenobacter sp. CRA2]
MRIESQPDMRGATYHIIIRRSARTTKLVYARRDSIRRYFDPVEDSLRREYFDKPPDNKEARWKLIGDIGRRAAENHRRYAAYTKDSIALKNTQVASRRYVALLDSVFLADDDAFHDFSSVRTVKAKTVMVIHATQYRLYREAAGQPVRKAYMTAPDMDTNPLFVRLLTQTLELYRLSHPNSFMDKRYTRDY